MTTSLPEPFLRSYLPFLLVRADVLLSKRMLSELERFDCSVPEWRILSTLYDSDRLVIGTLAELVLLPQPTVSRWVTRLVAQGLVKRSNATDRRQTVVELTADGATRAERLISTAVGHLRSLTDNMAPHDLARLEQILRSIISSLETTESGSTE